MTDILNWFSVMTAEALGAAKERDGRSAHTFTWERLYTSLTEANFLRFQDKTNGSALVSLLVSLH